MNWAKRRKKISGWSKSDAHNEAKATKNANSFKISTINKNVIKDLKHLWMIKKPNNFTYF